MKIRCPSMDELRKQSAEIMKNRSWKLVRAWRPCRISDQEIVWLELVSRQIDSVQFGTGWNGINKLTVSYKYGPAHNALLQPNEQFEFVGQGQSTSAANILGGAGGAGGAGIRGGNIAAGVIGGGWVCGVCRGNHISGHTAACLTLQSGFSSTIGSLSQALQQQGQAVSGAPTPGGRYPPAAKSGP